jgi:DNA-binding transcriptional ArsR family regulator
MCSNEAEPQEVFYLERAHLRLISDPVRQRILGLLCRKAMSATELKNEIADAPSNLHYHVDRLREAGLIQLERTEPRRGATEKYYRAVARAYTLAPELAALVPADRTVDEDVLSVVRSLLENNYMALTRSLQRGLLGDGEGSVAPVITGCTIRTSRQQMEALRQALIDWLKDCQESEDPEGDVELALLGIVFPVDLGADPSPE